MLGHEASVTLSHHKVFVLLPRGLTCMLCFLAFQIVFSLDPAEGSLGISQFYKVGAAPRMGAGLGLPPGPT